MKKLSYTYLAVTETATSGSLFKVSNTLSALFHSGRSGLGSTLTMILAIFLISTLTVPVVAQTGAALDFDGSNDRVDIADAAWNDFGTGNFTVECWIKKQAGSSGWSNVTGVGKWNTGGSPGTNEWLIALTSDGNDELPNFVIEVGSTSYTVKATTPMSVGTWYHIAGVRESNTLKIYVNGVLEGTTTNAGITGSINNIAAREIILGKLDGFGGHTNMEMDELRIWGSARTAAEILANKDCEVPTTGTNLLANYHFNQGTADANNVGLTSLTDVAGSSRNGTLFNFGLTGISVSNWTAPGGVVSGTSCGPCAMVLDTLTTNVSCFGGSNGEATVSVTSGGTAPYTYLWSNGGSAATISSLTAGSYSVTVTSTGGCTNTISVTIAEPVELYVNITGYDPDCEVGNNGIVELNSIAGGTPPLSFLWSNSATTEDIFGVTAGMYSVTITENNGCTSIKSYELIDQDREAPKVFCKIGTGLDFDGVDEYVSVPDNAALGNMGLVTVMGWVKIDALPAPGQNYVPIGKENAYRLVIGDDGSYQFVVSTTNNGWYSTGTFATGGSDLLPIGQWVHLAGVYNGTNVRVFVNGVLKGETTDLISGTIVDNGNPFTIAQKTSSNIDYFNGKIDEVAVFENEYDEAQIQAFMETSLSGTEADLLAYYNLEEGTGSTANDIAGSAQNGTLVNMDAADWMRTPFGPNNSISVYTDLGLCTTALIFDVAAMDNCGTPTTTNDFNMTADASGNYPKGTTTVTWTATDSEPTTTTCAFSVTVVDSIKPIAVCQDITVNLDNTGNGTATATAVDNMSTDNCAIVSSMLNTSSFTCANIAGPNSVTLTVSDASNNSSTCTASVTVIDGIPPVALCQDITVHLNASGNASTTAATINNGSSDACGVQSVVLNDSTFTCSDVAVLTTITLTVTDVNTNTKTCTASVTVLDTVAPIAICQNVTVWLNASGMGNASAAAANNGSNDACGILSLSLSDSTFTCANITGPNSVTLKVTDLSSNIKTCSASVTVLDTVKPKALCQNVTVWLNASGMGSTTSTAVNNGSTDACGIQSIVLNDSTYACASIAGPNTVTLTVTDLYNNSSSCTATVTVIDTVKPMAICQNVSVWLNASGIGSTSSNSVNNGSNDACAIQSVVLSDSTFNCANIAGPNMITLTVTDVNSNIKTCTATVVVIDTIKPVALCQNVTVWLNASGAGTTSSTAVNNSSTDACGIQSTVLSDSTYTCANVAGPNTVTLTVTDVNSNVSSCTAAVTVLDTVKPNAICQNVTVWLNGSGTGATSSAAVNNGSTDACGIQSLVLSDSTFTCANIAGPNTVALTVTDVNANSKTCTAAVTVLDTVPPNIVCPSSLTINAAPSSCTQLQGWVVPGATDNCGILSKVVTNDNGVSIQPFGALDFGLFPTGITTVTYTATDVNANAKTCTFTITVLDLQLPIITGCPTTIVQSTTPGLCTAVVTWVAPTASDNCPAVALTATHAPGSTFPVGTTMVTYTATDASNNTKTCAFNVTINDTEKPVITAPTAITINCGTNPPLGATDYAGFSSIGGTATDNCTASASLSVSYTDGMPTGNSCGGTIVRTYTVTDANLNAQTANQTITVNPAALPTMTAPSNVTIACGTLLPSASTLPFSNGLGGGCLISGTSNLSTFTTNVAGNCNGSVTETWTATDACGRSLNSVSRTIYIIDNVPPVITLVGDATVHTCLNEVYNDAGATANDFCSGNLTNAINVNNPVNTTLAGAYIVTYSVTDNCNNSASQVTRTVIVDPKPSFGFTATVTGRTGQTGNSSGGPQTVTINFCAGESFTISGYSSNPNTQVRFLEEIVSGTTNITYNGGPIAVPRAQQEADGSIFNATYGPYGLSSGTSGTLTQTFTPYFDTNNDGNYDAGTDCLGDVISLVYNVYANPDVIATPAADSICDLGTTSIALSGSVPGTTFAWAVQSTTGSVSGQSAGSGTTIAQTLDNTGSTIATVTYRVTPTGPAPNNCVGAYTDVTITVLPSPALRTTVNGVQLTNNFDGSDETGAFTVCNTVGNNIFFTEFIDALGVTPSANVKVIQQFTSTNVTTSMANATAPISAYAGSFDRQVSLINPALNGTLVMSFRTYYDIDNDNVLDTDECANDWVVYTVTVDGEAPVLVGVPANTTVDCGNIPTAPTVTATDNYGVPTVGMASSTTQGSAGTCAFYSYTITRTWTATDSCGNSASASQVITVNPPVAPSMMALGNTTLACGTALVPSTIPFTNGLSGNCLISGTSNPSTFTTIPGACGGTVLETWTAAADPCGRTIPSVSRIITFSPAALPTMTPLSDVTITCGTLLPTASTLPFSNGLGSGCLISGTSNLSTFTTNVSGNCNGMVTETWTATDACGRTLNSVSRTISIIDNVIPVITLVGPATVNLCLNENYSDAGATASDSCSGNLTSFISVNNPVNTAIAGTYTVTYNVIDNCFNSAAQVTRTVIVNPRPTFGFTATVTGRTAQSGNNTGGPSTVTLNFCAGESYTMSGYTSTPNTQVRFLEEIVSGTTNLTYNNSPITVPRAQQDIDATFFAGTYGPYGLSSGTSGTLTQTLLPYFDTNNDGNYDAGTDCLGDPISLVHNIYANPDAIATPATDSICDLGTTSIALSSSVPGTTFAWVVQSTTGSVTGQTAGSGTTIAQTLDNTGSTLATVTYRVTPTGPAPNNCVGAYTDVTITVFPRPALRTTVNGVQLTNNFDGSSETASFTVCNTGSSNIFFTQFIDLLGVTPAANVKVIQQFSTTNVTFGASYGIYPIGAYAGTFDRQVSLVNPTLNGTLVMTFRTFFDIDNDNILDADECANDLVVYTITVDGEAPVLAGVPGNVTVDCGNIPTAPTVTATDNYGTPTVTMATTTTQGAPGTCAFYTYTITRTWTATDFCGNTATASQVITVNPPTVPTMTPLGATTVACGTALVPTAISFSNGLSGGCLITGTSNASTFTSTPGVCGGTVTETWTATDLCGRTISSVSRTITISPAALPTMTALPAITVACGSIPAASTISFSNGLSGGCLISGTSNMSTFSPTPTACGGTVTETWTATDECGRTLAAVSRVITVTPAILPTMTAPDAITVACGGIPAPTSIAFSNGLSGGCLISGSSNMSTFSPTPTACGGTVTETWTATDICGRTITAVSRLITVTPASLPTMTAPAAITVSCGSIPATSTIAFSNNLSGGCLISGTSNASTFGPTPGACGGTVTETWTATDVCGRTISSVSRVITVNPAALPTIVAPSNITVTCGTLLPAPSTRSFTNGLTGGCLISGTSNLSTIVVNNSSNCNGSATETWTATDACGRTLASVSRTISIIDNVGPTALCKPVTLLLNSQMMAATNAAAVNNNSTDNCSGIQSLSLSKSTFNCSNFGPNTVILTATDNCQNTSTCAAIVTVGYTQAPVARCRNVIVTLNAQGNGVLVATNLNNGSTDLCNTSGLTFSASKTTFNCSNIGPNSVTLTVTSPGGASSSCISTVTVRDITKPQARCKNKIIPLINGSSITVAPSEINNVSTDACTSPPTLVSLVPKTFTCANSGPNIVTLTVSDASNNISTCSAVVTINCNNSNIKVDEEAAEANLVELMDVFPNPATDQVIIRLNDVTRTDRTVSIVDYAGKVMFTKVIPAADKQIAVDLLEQRLPSGIYAVTVRFADKVQTKQLVIFRD